MNELQGASKRTAPNSDFDAVSSLLSFVLPGWFTFQVRSAFSYIPASMRVPAFEAAVGKSVAWAIFADLLKASLLPWAMRV